MRYLLIVLLLLLAGCDNINNELSVLKDAKEKGILLSAKQQADGIKECEAYGFVGRPVTWRGAVVQIRCDKPDGEKQ